jgi:hypothetical protein
MTVEILFRPAANQRSLGICMCFLRDNRLCSDIRRLSHFSLRAAIPRKGGGFSLVIAIPGLFLSHPFFFSAAGPEKNEYFFLSARLVWVRLGSIPLPKAYDAPSPALFLGLCIGIF